MTPALASYEIWPLSGRHAFGASVEPENAGFPNAPHLVEPGETIHIVHSDKDAAAQLATLCRAEGMGAKIYASLPAFAEAPQPSTPCCLLLHTHACSSPEFDVLRRSGTPLARAPMIVVAERADVRTVLLAMKAGAIEIFDALPPRQELLNAIAGAIKVHRDRRQLAFSYATLQAAYTHLSERERQVMELVTRGLLNKQVAGELGITEFTVKVHRGTVMRKMSARTIADLVRMADALAFFRKHLHAASEVRIDREFDPALANIAVRTEYQP